MKKFLSLSFFAVMLSIASYALGPIMPATGSVCIGNTMYLTDSLHPGGVWTSSNTAIATIGSSTGIMTGVSAGVVTMTYTLSSAYVTGTYTVNAAISPIVGTGSICVGSTLTLTDATPGGTWYSSGTYYATVGATTGIVTGAHAGTVTIYYSVPGGCTVSTVVTVNATSAGTITGPSTVCAGGTITLADSLGTAGTWSSSNPAVATVGSGTGIVSGISVGTVVITYSVTGPCGTVSATRTITVTSTTTPGTITGPSSVMVGNSITLYNSVGGGTWSSSATGIATIGASSGVVTGVSVGTTTITYTVTGCGGPASVTYTVSVTPFDGISGHVLFGSAPFYGMVKVWLITYNPTTHNLQASDSVITYSSGTSAFYQFTGVATDSFRVKASANDSFVSTTGYIPTYHTGSYYWYSATVINHTAGTSDINKDINMSYGTTTSGPGFIAGDVTTGANKGTSGSAPVEGLKMVIVNSTTSQVLQSVRTDAAGHYSFSNLPVGQTYFVFPDSLNYTTIPYTGISLTAAAPSMSAASFVQHTISMSITPIATGVHNVNPAVSSVSAFPNPANGKLFIQWNEIATETASVAITDVTGHVLYNTTVALTQGSGLSQIDLSSVANGLYLISVKSASINYNSKIQVQH